MPPPAARHPDSESGPEFKKARIAVQPANALPRTPVDLPAKLVEKFMSSTPGTNLNFDKDSDVPALTPACLCTRKNEGLWCQVIRADNDHRQVIQDMLKEAYAKDDRADRGDGGWAAVDELKLRNMIAGPPMQLKNWSTPDLKRASPCVHCASAAHSFNDNAACRAARLLIVETSQPVSCTFTAPAKGPKFRPLQVCRQTYKQLFRIGSNAHMAALNEARMNNLTSRPRVNVGRPALTDEVREELEAILMKFKASTSHYSSSDSRSATEYMYAGDLNFFTFWKEYLKLNEPDFYAQAERLDYYQGYTPKDRQPNAAAFAADPEGVKLDPAVGYSCAVKFYGKFDISFRTLQTDRCTTCYNLNFAANNLILLPVPEAEENNPAYSVQGAAETVRAAAQAALIRHKQEADTSYALKARDVKDAKLNSWIETWQTDLASMKRTPLLLIGPAFFSSVISTMVWMCTSASDDINYAMLFDELMTDKGPNCIGSCILKMVPLLLVKYPLSAIGDATLVRLNLWMDGTVGQSWNNFTTAMMNLTTVKGSPFYCCQQLFQHRSPVGHTFMLCDTAGGYINRAANEYMRDQKKLGIFGTFDWDKNPSAVGLGDQPAGYMSWETIIRDRTPLTLVRLNQTDCFDIKKFFSHRRSPYAPTTVVQAANAYNQDNRFAWDENFEFNHGKGESADRNTYSHPGHICAKRCILQAEYNVVPVYKKEIMVAAAAAEAAAGAALRGDGIVGTRFIEAARDAYISNVQAGEEPWELKLYNGGVRQITTEKKARSLNKLMKNVPEGLRGLYPLPPPPPPPAQQVTLAGVPPPIAAGDAPGADPGAAAAF